jgi:hypothetical protein
MTRASFDPNRNPRARLIDGILRMIGGTRYYFVMIMSVDEITEAAIKLEPSARAALADKLIESLESEEPDEIQRLWTAEAIRRRDEVRAGKVQPVAGEQVLEEVRRLVGR